MKYHLCVLFILSLFAVTVAHAAKVNNITVEQKGSKRVFTFDLNGEPGEKVAEVRVRVFTGDDGKEYPVSIFPLSGDFGKWVKVGGGKRIVWDVEDKFRGYERAFRWDITAFPTRDLTNLSLTDLIYTDQKTGLMWVRDTNIADRYMYWDESIDWAKQVDYAGYSDWRLPSIEEFETIVKRDGKISQSWFEENGFKIVRFSRFWSSNNDTSNPDKAMVVFSADGSIRSSSKKGWACVWLVRAGQSIKVGTH
jgi:hypothetical protein